MRLTLRTMLAYLDDIDDLDPADHQELARKIEESEFATNLLQRIRDVARRMRLGAPRPLGRGIGLDPNTVAEYLDNMLQGERVLEFEKVCLESDVHLAEVACCHQILTLVLREPAEVDPGLRKQMYEIDTRSESAAGGLEQEPVGAGVAATPPPPPEQRPAPVREKPEVPEYLRRGSRSRFWPIAITVALALGLAFVIVSALGPLDATNPALKWLLGSKPGANDVAQNTPAKSPKDALPAPFAGGTNLPKEAERAADNSKSPAAAVEPIAPAPREPATSGGTKLVRPNTAPPAPLPTDDRVAPLPPLPHALNVKEGDHKPDAKTGAATPLVPSDALPAPPAPVASGGPPLAAGQPLGRLGSEQDVLLLQFDLGQGQWRRTPPSGTVRQGDKLLALPTFHPKINLATNVALTLYPETLVDLLGVDPQGVAMVRLEYGRVKLETMARADARLRLSLGRTGGTLVFSDPEATAAAEVRPFNLPGTDPEANPPRIGVALYAIRGQVEWQPDGPGDPLAIGGSRLKAPSGLVLAAFPADAPPDRELPKWLGEMPNMLDARAAQELNQKLDGKDAVTVVLREMAGHRRTENRSLAARSLYLIDEFDPFVEILNDPDQKSIWTKQIESVQAALNRSPNVAVQIRTTLERQIGRDGDDLYRMLWGYNKDQLQGGSAETLVEMLDNDNSAFSLAFRVLSFENLRTITGATFNYRPEHPAATRLTAVRRWREQLKDGLIVLRGAAPAKPAAETPAARGLPPASSPKVPPPPQPEQ